MNTYSLLGVKVDSTSIAGIQSQRVAAGIQTVVQGGSGSVDPYFSGVMFMDPRIEFETVQIATAIGVAGLSGDDPATNVICAFEQNTEAGLRSGTHRAVIATNALIVPRTLSVSQNSEASITYEVFMYGDASNAPFSVSSSSQTITQGVSEKFTLGACSLEGTAFDPQSLTIDFGIDVAVHSSSGLPWPTHVAIRSRRPTINITTLDVSKLGTIYPGSGVIGLTLAGADGGIFYLQKVAEGGGARVAAATTAHIKFSLTEGVAHFTEVGGSHNSEAAMNIMIEPTYDGTNAILQIDTASAIA